MKVRVEEMWLGAQVTEHNKYEGARTSQLRGSDMR